jgi:metallo-beta-lactamase family protein
MELAFLGAAGTVTGSRTRVSHEGRQILVACGLFQGYKNLRSMTWERPDICMS